MKKTALISTMFILLFVTLTASLATAAELPLRVVVNGDKVFFPDAQPFVDAKGRTQVPSRFIAEALGAKTTWNSKGKKATFELNGNILELIIGQQYYKINGHAFQMDTKAITQNERIFVPARYVAEAFGAEVKWDKAVWTVYIEIKADAKPKQPEGGKSKKYSGISFNPVTDVDQYGRMTEEKTKEFLLKLANQFSFVKEEGKYVVKCTYPDLPTGFEWSIDISIDTNKRLGSFSTRRTKEELKLPSSGSYTKVIPYVTDSKDVELYSLVLKIHAIDRTKLEKANQHVAIGLFDLVKSSSGILRASYVPESGPSVKYEDFNFDKVFQW